MTALMVVRRETRVLSAPMVAHSIITRPLYLNAALSFRLNWRGNFRSLEELTDAVCLIRA